MKTNQSTMKTNQSTMKNIFYLFLKCIFLLTLLGWPDVLFSQKSVRAKGTSQVRVESFITKDQARELAEERAMINAIENVYGTYVEQESDTRVRDGRVNFDIIGTTRVRGEWIRTINIEFSEETTIEKGKYGQEQILWIRCNISGMVRECVSRPNLKTITLNCPFEQCRTTTYFDGEDLYLYFKSPVDGYLSVFLADDNNAYRLLPYVSMGTLSAVKVEGDKEYILFSRNHLYPFNDGFSVDRLEMTTERNIENNNLYVVFSEDKYIKPILEDTHELNDGYYIPRSLGIKDFKKWLDDCRADMPDFQAKRIMISIEKQ